MDETDLVPGRSCGDCTVCCIVPGIDTNAAQKETNAACRNLCDGGCAIYETRPGACRSFHCAWRQLPGLDESWRPDRSGVLVQGVAIGAQPGLSLMLVAEPLKTVRQDWFLGFVAAAIGAGTPLLLALPGPRGHQLVKLLLNDEDMKKAVAGTMEQVRQVLRRAVKTLQARAPEKLVLQNRGNDMSGP